MPIGLSSELDFKNETIEKHCFISLAPLDCPLNSWYFEYVISNLETVYKSSGMKMEVSVPPHQRMVSQGLT